jgi:hypothetical protein
MNDVLEYKLNLDENLEHFYDSFEYYTEWRHGDDSCFGYFFNEIGLKNCLAFEIWFEIEILDYFDIFTPDGNIFPYSCEINRGLIHNDLNELFLQIIGKDRYYLIDECNIIKIPIMVTCLNFGKSIYINFPICLIFSPLSKNIQKSLGKGRFGLKCSKNYNDFYEQELFISIGNNFKELKMKNNEMKYFTLMKNTEEIIFFSCDLYNSIVLIIRFSEYFDVDRIELKCSGGEIFNFSIGDEDNIFFINKNKWDESMTIIIPSPNGIVKNMEDLEYLLVNKFQLSKINNDEEKDEIDNINLLKLFNIRRRALSLKFYYGNKKINLDCEWKSCYLCID